MNGWWGWWVPDVKAALNSLIEMLRYAMLQPTSDQCPLGPYVSWKSRGRSGVIRQWQMGVINRSPNIDIFFGGLSGESPPFLSRSAARGQGAGIHLRNSDSAGGGEGGGGEGRGGEGRGGRQHVNEPAQCHWAPHRTAIWRIKDSNHLAASPTLYPHWIRITQIGLCHNTPWCFGRNKKVR